MTIHISGQAASADHALPDGVLPAKQRRGRDTRDRLLEAGHALSAMRDIDTITVAEVARLAGCSVGAFYQRFRDKDAFFGVLVAQYLAEVRAATLALFADCEDDRLIGLLVARTVERFRRHAGLIRSATRRRMDDDALWEPIRASGHFVADQMIGWLAGRRGRPLAAADEIRVRFAFQILFGTLNNAVINRPGPLVLEDEAFVHQLERAFRLALFSAGPAPTVEAALRRRMRS
ncbi:MAG TPA: TetR/AcrR family transcriptional regulator [Hyphomicrobiales bacterium]|nr:TetR/AcrR family transcriptional regulator [Hyphomicrobiales bacterium]